MHYHSPEVGWYFKCLPFFGKSKREGRSSMKYAHAKYTQAEL